MKKLLLASLAALTLTACVQEASRTLPIQKVESAARPHMGVRVPVSVGNFDNRSSFMRGVFSNNEDRMVAKRKPSWSHTSSKASASMCSTVQS